MNELFVSQIKSKSNEVFEGDDFQKLINNIEEGCLHPPIIVEDNGDGTYTLIEGERYLAAYKTLGRETIFASIRKQSNLKKEALLAIARAERAAKFAEAAAQQAREAIDVLKSTDFFRE